MRILIADDAPLYRRSLEAFLTKEGYEVLACSDGAEALVALESPDPPRLAILDWVMPGMEGVEVCRKVRHQIKDPYIYIIVLTSKEKSEDIVAGLEAGADDYLIKPFEAQELRVRLRAGKRILDLQTEGKRQEEALRKGNEELKQALGELQKTQSLLVRQEKLASIGTLSSGVCHEILNPLNIMSATIQVMKLDEHPLEVNENLDVIMEQIQRATKITNNLRMFAHQKEAEIKPVDIHDLFDKTATLIEHDLELDNIMINRSYDPDLSLVYADEDQLTQVFLNLLNNAKDAMKGRQESSLTVQTKALDTEVEIRFIDTGTGIPDKLLDKIFDPFYTTKDPGKGTGLGLSIIHSIIEKHNGTIKVESEEGKGTTFVILLPTENSKG